MKQRTASSLIERLAAMKCVPCEGIDRLSEGQVENALLDLPGWVRRDDSIEKESRWIVRGLSGIRL